MTRLPFLLHPVTLASLVVLIANDHGFKYSHSGLVSGKASDFAGLILLPMLILGVLEMLGATRLRLVAMVVCSATGAAFAAAKLLPIANEAAAALLGGRVQIDPWDLVALPALVVPWLIIRGRVASNRAVQGSIEAPKLAR